MDREAITKILEDHMPEGWANGVADRILALQTPKELAADEMYAVLNAIEAMANDGFPVEAIGEYARRRAPKVLAKARRKA